MSKIVLLLLTLCVLLDDNTAIADLRPINVVTTIKPISLLVKDILGQFGSVELINNVDSHHELILKPSDIQKIKKADLIFHEGFAMKSLLNKYNNAIDLSKASKLSFSRDKSFYDQHFWLSPHNAILMSKDIADKLIDIDSSNADNYRHNLRHLIENIETSSLKAMQKFSTSKRNKHIVIHDAYQYFEEYFNLNPPLGCFYNSEHNTSSIKEVQKLINSIKSDDVQCIISDSNSGKKALGSSVKKVNFIVIEPLGNNNNYSSYMEFLDGVANEFSLCLG